MGVVCGGDRSFGQCRSHGLRQPADGPSLAPLLAPIAVMAAVTGLFAGASMATKKRMRMIAGLIAGEVVGIMAIVLVSMRSIDSLEQVMVGLSLAASFMAAPAALISFVVGWRWPSWGHPAPAKSISRSGSAFEPARPAIGSLSSPPQNGSADSPKRTPTARCKKNSPDSDGYPS